MCREFENVLKCVSNCDQATTKVIEDLTHKNKLFISSLEDKATAHFAEAEQKFDRFLERQEKLRNRELTFNIFMFGIILTIVGYVAVDSQKKADKDDVLNLKEAKALRELGDAYYQSVFVRKDHAVVDSTTYFWHMKAIFGGTLRGTQK